MARHHPGSRFQDQEIGMNYDKKCAIVTGGATGIGRALAVSLANHGCKVAIADIDLENAQLVVEDIESIGGAAIAYQCDVASFDQVTEVFTRAFEDLGPIELAFINAGVTQLAKLQDLEPLDLEWMFRVNVFGAWQCAKCFIEETRKAGTEAARLIFTGSENCLSIPSHSRSVGAGGYNMTKHAMLSMAETFRYELENENIAVSLALPGGVQTEIIFSVRKRQEEFGGAGTPVIADAGDLALGGDEAPPVLSPDRVAEIILKGVADDQFFIPTHPHILQDFLARAGEIEAAFGAAAL